MERHTLSVEQAVAFDDGTPYIKDPKSENVFRTVPIPDLVFPTIRDHVRALGQDKLFHMKDGRWVTKSSYRKMWGRILRHMQAV